MPGAELSGQSIRGFTLQHQHHERRVGTRADGIHPGRRYRVGQVGDHLEGTVRRGRQRRPRKVDRISFEEVEGGGYLGLSVVSR